MVKYIGIALIFYTFSFIGMSFSKSYRLRIVWLSKLSGLYQAVKIQLNSYSPTVNQLFKGLFDNGRLSDFITDPGMIGENNYAETLLMEVNKIPSLKRSDKNEFKNFLNELGKTNLDGQNSIIDGYIRSNELIISELRKNSDSKCRLYSCMGVLCGAFVSVILI